jgi:hypothetical protein
VFEEYEHEVFKHNYYQIKSLLDRKEFPIDSKNEHARTVKVRCPIIFISNYAPYYDRAFIRRIHIIEAVEALNNAEIRVPKETDSPEAVCIDIAELEDEKENNVLQAKAIFEKATVQACTSRVLQERNN